MCRNDCIAISSGVLGMEPPETPHFPDQLLHKGVEVAFFGDLIGTQHGKVNEPTSGSGPSRSEDGSA